jgi:hypothetical protein
MPRAADGLRARLEGVLTPHVLSGGTLLIEADRRADKWQIPRIVELTHSPPPTSSVEPYMQLLSGLFAEPSHIESGPWIRWSLRQADPAQLSPQADGCLPRFVRLAHATDDEILRFAQRWGPLGICWRHGHPSTHLYSRFCEPRGMTTDASQFNLMSSDESGFAWEPVAAWRRYAAQAKAVLSIRASMCEGSRINASDYIELDKAHGGDIEARTLDKDEYLAGRNVRVCVEKWLRAGHVEMKFRYDAETDSFSARLVVTPSVIAGRLGFGFLFGTLAIQLAAVLTSPRGVFRCDNPVCLTPYTPDPNKHERRPKRGPRRQLHFCPACREGDLVSKRLSAQRRRARRTD